MGWVVDWIRLGACVGAAVVACGNVERDARDGDGGSGAAHDGAGSSPVAGNGGAVGGGTSPIAGRVGVGGKGVGGSPDAGVGGVLDDAGAGPGGAGGAGTGDVFVDPVNGSDAATGTESDPFLTLGHAVTAVDSGDTIWLEDGVYGAATEAAFAPGGTGACGFGSGIAIPDGVLVRAVNARGAVLEPQGAHGLCAGSASLFALVLRRPRANGPLLEASSGVLRVLATRFENTAGTEPALRLGGSAAIEIEAQDVVESFRAPRGTFALLGGESSLSVRGGALHVAGVGPIFRVTESSRLELDGVTVAGIRSSGPVAIAMTGASDALVRDSSIHDLSEAVLLGAGTPHAAIEGSSLANMAAGIRASSTDGAGTADVTGTDFTDVSYALYAFAGSVHVTVTDALVTRAATAGFAHCADGSLRVNDSTIRDSAIGILACDGVSGAPSLQVRRSEITANRDAGVALIAHRDGIYYNLGSAGDRGENRIHGNGTGAFSDAANLRITGSGGLQVFAVGNAWDANVQDSDAEGRYGGSGVFLEVTSGSGPNYRILGGPVPLRLSDGTYQ